MTTGSGTTAAASRSARWIRGFGAVALVLLPLAGAAAAILLARRATPGAAPEPGFRPAPKGRRIAAAGVDLAAAFLLVQIPAAGWILASAFLLFRDSFLDGRGLGKRLFGLRAVAVTAEGARSLAGDPLASFARNATLGLPGLQLLLLPVEGLLVLLGARRIGERAGPDTAVGVLDLDTGGG